MTLTGLGLRGGLLNRGQLLNLWLLGQDTERQVAFDGWKCDCVNVRLKVLIKHKCIENSHFMNMCVNG